MNAIDVRYNYCNVGNKTDTNSTGSKWMKKENIKRACFAGCPSMYSYTNDINARCMSSADECYKCWKNAKPNKELERWGK